MRYQRHIFVCVNEREEGHHRGCCKSKGGEEVRGKLKELIKSKGLKAECRANSAGCLDACEFGVSAVVYPDGIWYGGLTVDDAEEIVEKHLIEGRPVERLLIRHKKYTSEVYLNREIGLSEEEEGASPKSASDSAKENE